MMELKQELTQSHKCEGVEIKNNMQYVNDDVDCEDLICDECAEKEKENEPLKLKVYVVDILRTSYSSKRMRVTAFTEEKAGCKAVELVENLEFIEQSADYSIEDLKEIIIPHHSID